MKNKFQRMASFSIRFLLAAVRSSACIALLVGVTVATKSAAAQTYKVLYIFTGGADGAGPSNQLVGIGENLYGTTGLGGASGDGVVFKLAANGKETVVHSFSGPDGRDPTGLSRDMAGNLYGLTQIGGTAACTGIIEFNGHF